MKLMIKTIGLTKRYDNGVLALQSLDLSVGSGEIYCLLGANGAGKTTTINILLNFIAPTAGQASINGIDVVTDPLRAKKCVAFLPENVMLYGNFTARENLDFFGRLAGRKAFPTAEHARLVEEVGLPAKVLDHRVQQFSKGMRQKLGIAICMAKNAPALILDEPTSGLDPKAASELMAALSTLRDKGRTILMSTHDVFRAKEIADRVGILREGVKVMEETRDQLAHEDLERLYLYHMSQTRPSA